MSKHRLPRPVDPPAGAKEEATIPPTSYWVLDRLADRHSLRLTAECISDIAVSVTRANDLLLTGQLPTRVFQRECRDISVRIRKLILPNDAELLKQCFVPTMHPLKTIDRSNNPETLSEWIGNISIEFTNGYDQQLQQVTLPSAHQHQTVIGPLHGLTRTSPQTYRFADPFDWSATPLRLGQWLNLKILKVDDLTINAEQMLRMMVNSEGAHSQLNEMETANPELPVPVTRGPRNKEPYRKANVINFSGISFVQIFTFLVGFYLARMMRATLRRIPRELTQFSPSGEMWSDILKTPTRLAAAKLKVERAYEMGVLLHNAGEDEQPFRLVGEYQTPSRTVVQVP